MKNKFEKMKTYLGGKLIHTPTNIVGTYVGTDVEDESVIGIRVTPVKYLMASQNEFNAVEVG